MELSPRAGVFTLNPPAAHPLASSVFKAVARPLSRLLALDGLDRRYRGMSPEITGADFVAEVLRIFSISLRVAPGGLERIPAAGPLVVVANHPFGGVEGVLLAHMLLGVRPDVKLMANSLLGRIPELRELFILVNPFGGAGALAQNVGPLKECMGLLRSGGALGVFPAGEVAHFNVRQGRVAEPEWNPVVARLIRKTGATVLPVHFCGSNGPVFHLAGMIHPRLRTALLAREFVNKARRTLEARIGAPIPAARFDGLTDEQMLKRLRLRVEMLGRTPARQKPRRWFPAKGQPERQPLIEPQDPWLMAAEVSRLAPERLLVTSGELAVFEAPAAEIPLVLREIGRLRETSFRLVGEGTGRPCDLDGFDHVYSHMFLWNRRTSEVAGAYRIGRTDEILAASGPEGLYVSTLFKLKAAFLRELGPALELGRSFVSPQYQKSYNALLLLWRGIGAVVARQPKYRKLFGPVSVTGEYQLASRQLIARYFETVGAKDALTRLVRPRKPLRGGKWLKSVASSMCTDTQSLSDLVAEMEPQQAGLPVLMRQYLKMGGKVLAFNVDPAFSNALDGLIVVDLLETDEKLLERYMGKQGVAALREHHLGGYKRSA